MNKFKIKQIGFDLRDVNNVLVSNPYSSTEVHKNPSDLYVLVDLFSPSDHLYRDFCESIRVNGGRMIISIDLGKFHSEDVWEEAYNFYKIFQRIYWEYNDDDMILFRNLPSDPTKGKTDVWNGFTVGLEIVDNEKWKDEIGKWKSMFDDYPNIIARKISPLYFSLDLEKFIELKQASSIALDWNGGKIMKESEYEAFGKSYLLSFASFHSDIVLLPLYKDYFVESEEDLVFLEDMKHKDIEEKESAKFIIKKNVSRISKTPKKLIYESLRLPIGEDVDWVISSSGAELLYSYDDTTYSFSKPKIETPLDNSITRAGESDIVERVREYLDHIFEVYIDKNRSGIDFDVAWKIIYMEIYEFLVLEFPEEDRWKLDICNIGQYAISINASQIKKKNWLTKSLPDEIVDSRTFILYMKSPDSIYFLDVNEIENSEKD